VEGVATARTEIVAENHMAKSVKDDLLASARWIAPTRGRRCLVGTREPTPRSPEPETPVRLPTDIGLPSYSCPVHGARQRGRTVVDSTRLKQVKTG
jgi:hypothetical protein